MDEKRKEELRPLIDAARELSREGREAAKRDIESLRLLGGDLFELGERCAESKRSRALGWTLMQVIVEGQRGYQLFVFDHELGDYVWHVQALSLSEIRAELVEWMKERAI